MASAEGGAGLPSTPTDDNHEISDTDSDSSHVASIAPALPCPYRHSRSLEGECTHYFDCPTHILERLNPESYDDDLSGPSDQTAEIRSESGPARATSIGGSNIVEYESSPAEDHRRDGVVIDTPDSEPLVNDSAQNNESREGASSIPSGVAPIARSDTPRPEMGITLREALDETRESRSGSTANDAVPQITHIAATLNRDSPSTPIAPAFNPTTDRRSPPEFTLPRWQPDAEVTYCPICGTQFGFFVRKHHCRKCGRVVCAGCSPHRITIPYQYIVRPPQETAFLQRYGVEGGIADFSTASGGEPVRLCNPCVPDPNTTPPGTRHPPSNYQPRSAHHRSQSTSSSNFTPENQFPHPLSQSIPSPVSDYYARGRSATVVRPPLFHGMTHDMANARQNAGSSSSRTNTSRISSAQYGIGRWPGITFNPSRLQQHHHQPHPLPSSLNARVRYLLDFAEQPSSSASASSSSMAAGRGGRNRTGINRPLPPPPPQIAEEDECPVCHYELPSRSLPDFETKREAHINDCIMQHSTYSPGSGGGGGGRPRLPSGAHAHGTPPPRMTRRTGIFPYTATEKDCVDDAECTICLEEFQVGVPMARLECLCRFHRSCIQAWFVNHPGRCPVHQHDSFGY